MAQSATQQVLVARASIQGAPKVEVPHQVPRVSAKVGETIDIAVDYVLDEESLDKEAYGFTVTGEVSLLASPENPRKLDPVGLRWGDRRGRHDHREGRLALPVRFDKPGQYGVRFTVEADHTKLPWGKHELSSNERMSATGLIHVDVA